MKIAVMQPYLFPYAGYYRLFTCDAFVIMDDVQFNRRGRVHRCEVNAGTKKWMTLPIKKTDRGSTLIKDLEWAVDPMEQWYKQVRKFPELKHRGIALGGLVNPNYSPLEIIVSSIGMTCQALKLECASCYASDFNIDQSIRGQDRIIEICKRMGATEYVNSPGGMELYDEKEFEDKGIKLTFFPPWLGNCDSVLELLSYDDPDAIKKEIYAQI